MFSVLSYTTVTGRNVAAVLAGLAESGRHLMRGFKGEGRE